MATVKNDEHANCLQVIGVLFLHYNLTLATEGFIHTVAIYFEHYAKFCDEWYGCRYVRYCRPEPMPHQVVERQQTACRHC